MYSDNSASLLVKYKKALTDAKMGLWELNFSTGEVHWDEGIHRLYEMNGAPYVGNIENWYRQVHEEDRDRLRQEIEESRRDLSEVDSLFRVVLQNGKQKFIRSNGIKQRNERNEVVGLIGMNWDVTEEFISKENLNKSKTFLEKVLDALPDPVFIKDEQHKTIFANQEFLQFCGKQKSELIGRLDFDFLPLDRAKVYWRQDEIIINSNQAFESEEVATNAVGETRQLLTKKMAVEISSFEKIIVGVIRDITEIKNIQNSLIEQSKMASLGEMAAEMAHEINNPLMIIQVKAQLLQERFSSEEHAIDRKKLMQDLHLIENNSLRIDKIIKSLRAVSRKSDQNLFQDASIKKMVEDAVEAIQERLKLAKIEFHFSCDETIDYIHNVKARPPEIVQAFVNLLQNSIDAVEEQLADAAPAWIQLSLRMIGTQFKITVTDSGPPISEAVARRMMEPFFTTKGSGKGAGLGLSVAKQIIANHGGLFKFETEAKHTQFSIQMKRSEAVWK